MDQSTEHDLQLGKWLAGAALGAVVMYMLDPDRGAPRRAQSGRALRKLGRRTGDVFDKVANGIGARAAQAGSAVRHAASETAEAVRQRAAEAAGSLRDSTGEVAATVRDAVHGIGSRAADTASSYAGPGSSHGQASDSPVHDRAHEAIPERDSGRADARYPDGSSTAAAHTDRGPGEKLDASLQAAGMRIAGMASAVSSGSRNAALAGSALALYGLVARRTPLGFAAGLAGLALLASSAGTGKQSSRSSAHRSSRPLRSLLGAANPARPVAVEKTIRIDASPEQVYDMFANYENFPRYMSNVIEVRDLGDRRSHWFVRGPAGTHFQWNARLTESSRPRRLAWESEPGAEVEQTGSILFEPFRNGTRVTVHMSYRPPAGAVGHALASLLGSDPKRQMDQDLARMKSLVERGAASQPAGAAHESGSKFLH